MRDEIVAMDLRVAWEERARRKLEQEKSRRDQARQCAENVAAMLRTNFGIHEIWLFGSLVSGKHFTVHSDIDMFVGDFPPAADYWEVLRQAEHIAAPFPLTLLIEANAWPRTKARVRSEGVLL